MDASKAISDKAVWAATDAYDDERYGQDTAEYHAMQAALTAALPHIRAAVLAEVRAVVPGRAESISEGSTGYNVCRAEMLAALDKLENTKEQDDGR